MQLVFILFNGAETINLILWAAPFSGTIRLPTANGIKFPENNTGNADPNTLDDYEEGTDTRTSHWRDSAEQRFAHSVLATKMGGRLALTRIALSSKDSLRAVTIGNLPDKKDIR